MKKTYQKSEFVEIELHNHLLQTVSGEQSQSGTKEGEGGDDLSRRAGFSKWNDED